MFRRVLASLAVAVVIAAMATLPVSGQSSGQGSVAATAPQLVVTAFNGGPAPANWTSPKTPWGEPDLQGVWSSDDATFGVSRGGGRGGAAPTGLYLDDEQWAARQKQIQQGITNAENAVGSFRGDFARRAFRQTSYIVDPPDGVQPQPLPEARKRTRVGDRGTFGDGPFHTFDDFTNYDRCITRGIWGSVVRVIYGNGNRIVQAPGMVAISYEMIHDTRIIYTDGRPHINDGIRQYLGDSRGWWEGDTLVVETTNLTDQTSIGANGNGLRHSDKMTMVERIRRVADDIVQYQLTVIDPVTYPRPFTISIPLTPLDGGVLLPYECHEGNGAVRNALAGERAEERALADDLSRGILRPRRGPQEDGLGAGAFGGGPRVRRGSPEWIKQQQGGRGGAGRGGRAGGPPAEGDQER
jgi:hypothetical protein